MEKTHGAWHTGELIALLVDMAGLLHDLGKAIENFQLRLKGRLIGRNRIRHEWVSVRLFEAFVGNDDDTAWLTRLSAPTKKDDDRWLQCLHKDGVDGTFNSPFKTLSQAPLAQALAWLVVTHHRLPELPSHAVFQMSLLPNLLTQLQPSWNERAFDVSNGDSLREYWQFPQGLPITTDIWRQRARRIARHLLPFAADASHTVLDNPFVLHLSRLSLMLADHYYSGLEGTHSERIKVVLNSPLVANTCNGSPNQSLDEHLVGVAQHAAEIAHFLPHFEQHLPRLGRCKRLKQRSQNKRFHWQDQSADLIAGMREQSLEHGAFIVNMASTGCGKTLGNARIMYALADPHKGMRCAFALGLRTLTLQTGKAFQEMLGLGDNDLAILVGGSANRTLFEHYEAQAEATGSASQQKLLDEDTHVNYEGQIDQHPLLRRAISDPQVRKLLVAPLLVCTIDHLTPATESQRGGRQIAPMLRLMSGGRQIAPMLRLMSGDLVLDEPDDFDLSDLPALTRLVHWAGLLGARVLLSSATLPPALIEGLFAAYRNGRQHFQRNRAAYPDAENSICCAWIDEYHQHIQNCSDSATFLQTHAQFVDRRYKELARLTAIPRCRAAILPVQGFMQVI